MGKLVKAGSKHTDEDRTQLNLPTLISSNQDNRELADVWKELSTMRDLRVVAAQKDSSVQAESNG